MTKTDHRFHHFVRPATLALLGVLLASCASGSKVTLSNVVVGETTTQDVSADGLAALNRFRASQGLGPVTIEPRLVELAKFQATAMATRDALTHEVAGDFDGFEDHGLDRAADVAEQAMLNRIVFRAARRVVRHLKICFSPAAVIPRTVSIISPA